MGVAVSVQRTRHLLVRVDRGRRQQDAASPAREKTFCISFLLLLVRFHVATLYFLPIITVHSFISDLIFSSSSHFSSCKFRDKPPFIFSLPPSVYFIAYTAGPVGKGKECSLQNALIRLCSARFGITLRSIKSLVKGEVIGCPFLSLVSIHSSIAVRS